MSDFTQMQLAAAKAAREAYWSPRWIRSVPSEDSRIDMLYDYCIAACSGDRAKGLELARQVMVL